MAGKDKNTNQKGLLKSEELAKKLNDYMLENNKEMYEYLYGKKELKDFLVLRSNAAYDARTVALSEGVPSPDEVCNQILFCGLENSYREYIESILADNFPEFYNKLNKKNITGINSVYRALIYACIGIFYEYLSFPYDKIMDQLDEKLISAINETIHKISI